MKFPDLKPCPFCKGKVKFVPGQWCGERYWDIMCFTEGCFMEHGTDKGFIDGEIGTLADMWNRRGGK